MQRRLKVKSGTHKLIDRSLGRTTASGNPIFGVGGTQVTIKINAKEKKKKEESKPAT